MGVVLADNPWLSGVCISALILIVLHHSLFSISVDTSFAPSWIAAMLPLMALLGLLTNPALVFTGIAWIVFLFAAISAVEFTFWGLRAHTPLFEPNNYVTLLYLAWLPWVLTRAAADAQPAQHILSALITLIVCTAMFATHSRFAFLVVAGCCLLLVFLCWRQDFGVRHTTWILGAAGLAAGLYVWLTSGGAGNVVTDMVAASSEQGSAQARWLMVEAAWQMLEQYGGLSGIGLYNYAMLYPMFRPLAEQETGGQFVHNDYLQVALEGGVWLSIPLVVLFGCISYVCLRGVFFRQQWDPRVAYAIGVGVALLHALVNFVLYVLPLTIVLGVLVANVFRRDADKPGMDGAVVRRVGWLVWLVMGLGLTLNVAYLLLDSVTYDAFAPRSNIPLVERMRANPDSLSAYVGFAQNMNPDRGVPILGEAKLLEYKMQRSAASPDLVAQAEAAYQRAIVVDPWNPSAYTNYYQFLTRYKLLAKFEHTNLLREAQRLNPRDLTATALFIDYYLGEGDTASAMAQVRNLLPWCEILHRTESDQFADLLHRFGNANFLADTPQLREEIEQCGAVRGQLNSAGRRPTILMRYLRDG